MAQARMHWQMARRKPSDLLLHRTLRVSALAFGERLGSSFWGTLAGRAPLKSTRHTFGKKREWESVALTALDISALGLHPLPVVRVMVCYGQHQPLTVL